MSALQWILIAIICGAIEIITIGFWFIWLAFSALFVALGTSLGWLKNLETQFLIFAFISLFFIIITRPLIKKFFDHNDTASNVQALIGQHGICITAISPLEYGQVKVNGETWTAFSGEDISLGERIVVMGIEGVKLYVEKAATS